MIDPVADYAGLMERLFDFDALRALFAGGVPHALRRDARRHGPYAKEILERRARRADGTVMNGEPLPDFGGGHPDPNLDVRARPRGGMMSAPTRRTSAQRPTATATAT